MGNSGSTRFIDSFDPAVPIPKGVNHPDYRVHAAVQLNLHHTSSSSDSADGNVSNPTAAATTPMWRMWHAVVKAQCPYIARSDLCTRYRNGDGAVPVTIFQLNPEATFPGGPAGRTATFTTVGGLLRALSCGTAEREGGAIVDESVPAAAPTALSRFPIAVQHVDSDEAQGLLFAVAIGQYAPVCRAAPVKIAPGLSAVPNPIDVHVPLPSSPWHPYVTMGRPLRKRPLFGPDILCCTEVLYGLCDLADALHALHTVHVAQHRTLSWDNVCARNDSPGGRCRWVPWFPHFALTSRDLQLPLVQKRIVDASLARGKADLVYCAPEDKDPSLTDAARRELPLHASDAFAFGVMLQQCMPPAVMEGVTAATAPPVHIASSRQAAESLAVFAAACQSADALQRPPLSTFVALPIVQRSTFVRVMRQLDYWYPDDDDRRSPSVDAKLLPTSVLVTQPEHLQRAVFFGSLHVELQKLPYELSLRRVLPRVVLAAVLDDPCAGPFFEHVLKAIDATSPSPPKPAGTPIPLGASSAPGVLRPNRFLCHGLLQQEHHATWMAAMLTSADVGFGDPSRILSTPHASYRWLVLLRHIELYVFAVDIAVITGNIVPGVVTLLGHPAPDVAAAALIAFGKLCKFVFAAVERGRDVGTAKDQLIQAYDNQVYSLAVKQPVVEVRIAALRIAARSIEKHKLMSRSKVCAALRIALQHPSPVAVIEATLRIIAQLSASSSPAATAEDSTALAPAAGTDDDTSSSRRSVSPTGKPMVGVFYPSEVAQQIFPGLLAVAVTHAGSTDLAAARCSEEAANLFSRLCDDVAALDTGAHAPADGLFVTNAAAASTSSEWDAAGLLTQPTAFSNASSATDDSNTLVAPPLRVLGAHTPLVPVPFMPVDPDGHCRFIPKASDLPPPTSPAYAPSLSTRAGNVAVLEVPTVVPHDDFDVEWCGSSFLALPAAQSNAAAAGPNLRPHPIGPYLSTRLVPPSGATTATTAASSGAGLGTGATAAKGSTSAAAKGRSSAQARREAAANAARLAAELAAKEAREEAAATAETVGQAAPRSVSPDVAPQAPPQPTPPQSQPPATSAAAPLPTKAPPKRRQQASTPAQAVVTAAPARAPMRSAAAPAADDDDL